MKRKYQRTLALIFAMPTSANIQWRDIEAMFQELGAEVSEREGSRVAEPPTPTKALSPAFVNG